MQSSPLDDINRADTEALIIEVLKTIRDPELPMSIYDMGLIYGIDITPDGAVTITMTLTTPMCPAAEVLPPEVQQKVGALDGVTKAHVNLVWEPPWTPELMSEAARLESGLM